jgi:hypothetical protein
MVATASVRAIAALLIAVTGCVVILPKSQNAPRNGTKKAESSDNVTLSVRALGERQRYRASNEAWDVCLLRIATRSEQPKNLLDLQEVRSNRNA